MIFTNLESFCHSVCAPAKKILRVAFGMLAFVLWYSNHSSILAQEGWKEFASVEGIKEYRLENGLKILLFSDNSQPKVTINCTLFLGSRHEGYGEAGMAHLLEHMLFKGTDLHPNIPKALEERGAVYNAKTRVDATNYFETLPATDENLEFAIRLEADRMVNSKIRNEDLASEFTVIRNEFEACEKNPVGILTERMNATAYLWHNYGKSTIGNRSDIERVNIDSLRAFYRRHYRPDNAMLIVAGQFEESKALEYITKYFGILPKPKPPLRPTYTVEPPQDGERITTVQSVGEVQAVGVCYHVPFSGDPQFASLKLFGQILTTKPSGRLYKSLIESKLATAVEVSAEGFHDPGVIGFVAEVPMASSLEKAEDALVQTIEGLSEAPITDEEVTRAKQRFLYHREQIATQSDLLAMSLSDWAAQGDWRLYFLFRDNIENATVDSVQLAAKTYLVRNNRTVGRFIPTKKSERISIPERINITELVENYRGRAPISEGEQFDPSPQNIESKLVRGKCPSGMHYVLLPKKTRGSTVNMTINLRFGDEKSLFGRKPACELLGPWMDRGSISFPLQQRNDKLAELKATLSLESGPQYLTARVETKRENLIAVLDVLEDVLRRPMFEETEFQLLVSQWTNIWENQRTDPKTVAGLAVMRGLNAHKRGDIRYMDSIEERLEDLKKLKPSDVRDLHSKFLSGSEGEIAIVGDVDMEATVARLAKLTENWKSKTPFQRAALTAMTDVKEAPKSIHTADQSNSFYYACQQYALRDDHPDYPALLMGSCVFGASYMSSRLGERIRQKEGFPYQVRCSLDSNQLDELATFSIEASADPKGRDKLVQWIDDELKKLVKDGVIEKELRDAIQGYLQSQQLQRSSDADLAVLLANNIFADRNMLYYEKLETAISQLTVDAVNDAIKEFISPETLIIATAGDFGSPPPSSSPTSDKP
ncbi:MAG: M16 family metallopeptidase [Pirellula sp.]|jgi:zinc protease